MTTESSIDRPDPPARPLLLKLLIGFAFMIAAFNVGAYLYGLTLPDEWRVEESIVVSATPAEIHPLLASPKRWPEWSPWSKDRDPSAELAFDGPESGVGASLSWQGEALGVGKLTLTSDEPDAAVGYELRLGGGEFSKDGRIGLVPADGGTRVIWTDGGDLGGTLGRLFGDRLEKSVSADFFAALERLKVVAEKGHEPGRPYSP